MLLIQRASTTISSTILANLWSALELPTAQQVQRLRNDLAALQGSFQASREFTRTRTPNTATIGNSQVTSQSKAGSE